MLILKEGKKFFGNLSLNQIKINKINEEMKFSKKCFLFSKIFLKVLVYRNFDLLIINLKGGFSHVEQESSYRIPQTRVGQKKQKCENLFCKYLMQCSITQGLLEHFYLFPKMGSKGLSRGVNTKVDFQDVPNYLMWVL